MKSAVKILLSKRRALGDTVLLAGSVAGLAQAVPNAEISVLVPAAFASVLEGNPRVKRIWTFEEGWVSLLRRVRAERFDHFFQLHASTRTKGFAWASGAQHVHYHVQNKDTEKAYGKHPNALEWDAFHFRTVFGAAVPVPSPTPVIHLTAEEKEEGRAYWARAGVDPSRVVFLGLGASRATKRWPAAHFAKFAELVRDRRELVPAFVVGPGEVEAAFAAQVIDEMRVRGFRPAKGEGKGDFVHGAGLSVRRLAGALSACRAYVGNDSGPKHMAVAVGIPTLTMFGSEDPAEWHPYDREAHPVFFRAGDLGPWRADEAYLAEAHRRMQEIDPLDVYFALEKRIG